MLFWKLYDRLEGLIALLALTGVVVTVLMSGIGRSIGYPVQSAPQYAGLFLIWTVMFGADLAVRSGENIRVTLLTDMLPPRGRTVLSFISIALILPFLGFVAWQGWHLAINNWQRELGASSLSYGLVTLALPVGAVLLFLSFLRRLLRIGVLNLFEPVPYEGAEIASHKEDLL